MVAHRDRFLGPPRPKKHKNRSFSSPRPRLTLGVSGKFAFKLTKMLLKGFWKFLIPLWENGILSFFSLCDWLRTTKSADFAFFFCLFFDFACCQASVDVFCMRWLVNIQNFIFHGHFGAKNRRCAVYHCHSLGIDVCRICLFPGFVWRGVWYHELYVS